MAATPSLEDLLARQAALQSEIDAQMRAGRADAIKQIKSLMSTYGIPAEDLVRGVRVVKAPKTKKAGTAKYRDPATGATWTGHGRAPEWIKAAKSRDAFLIGATAPKKAAPKKATRKVAKKARRRAS